MWKLLFFVLINGQPYLDVRDTNGPADCQAKAEQMIEIAKKEGFPLAVRCVEIKVA